MSSHTQDTPRSVEVTYTCDCGSTFVGTVYHAVNVTLEPQLLYTLLSGRLNTATCQNCGRQATSSLPFLYHDMRRGLFAYVHPRADLDEEERDDFLEQLRHTYSRAVQISERISPPRSAQRTPSGLSNRDHPAGVSEPDAPPMQVIFGVDRLVALVESLLEPEERLGHVALNTASHDTAARERLVRVAGRIASELGCQIDAREHLGTFTVEIYGSRKRISQLVSMLHSAT